MSYEFHKGDLYVEMLDQFHNSHGEYVPASLADVVSYLTEQGAEVKEVRWPRSPIGNPLETGRYLVFRLPVLADSTQPREEGE